MRSATTTRPSAPVRRTRSATPEHRNPSLPVSLGIAAVAAFFHVGAVLVVHVQTHGIAQFPDARGYDEASARIAAAWANGNTLGLEQLWGIANSRLFGYQTLMALCRFLTATLRPAPRLTSRRTNLTGCPSTMTSRSGWLVIKR